ncbi:hypothetical protein BP5796_07349 [Coleophoma crateriformis]|uniref:Ribosomal protein S2 n=1 Tax=Coleophoma crateriformis TaxID=565419 RepID=A0A3D8RIN2_9HELO|nr:hypothetical protein BP5796_07349 [Coleophoma crateriformis]
MILRNVAVRHGRRALAAPLRRSWIRSLSSEIDAIEQSIKNELTETGSIEANLNQLKATRHLIPPLAGIKQYDEGVARDYYLQKSIKKHTAKLGSVITPHYEPYHVLQHPPAPKDVTLELLMASQAHLGHATSLWNPANQRYIYGIRQGIHIISLETTATHLRRAAKVVEGVAYHGGLILFVGTRPGQDEAVIQASEMAKGCHLFERWIPGSITNGDQILPTHAVKALDEHDNEVPGFEHKFEKWKALKPDLVVCLNPLENYILLHECGLNNIPTIGVIDTDADPTWVTYPIPANDDSLRCTQLIAAVLGKAGEQGQTKRLEAAKTGTITWFPPDHLGKPVTADDIKRAQEQRLKQREERDLKEYQRELKADMSSQQDSMLDRYAPEFDKDGEEPLEDLEEEFGDVGDGGEGWAGEMRPFVMTESDFKKIDPQNGLSLSQDLEKDGSEHSGLKPFQFVEGLGETDEEEEDMLRQLTGWGADLDDDEDWQALKKNEAKKVARGKK